MAKAYPSRYRVEVTGPAQGAEWEGEVLAKSKQAAVLLAGYEMGKAGRWPTDSPYISVRELADDE